MNTLDHINSSSKLRNEIEALNNEMLEPRRIADQALDLYREYLAEEGEMVDRNQDDEKLVHVRRKKNEHKDRFHYHNRIAFCIRRRKSALRELLRLQERDSGSIFFLPQTESNVVCEMRFINLGDGIYEDGECKQIRKGQDHTFNQHKK